MKTLGKYQLNQNPKYIDTFPFRTESGLEALLICKQRRSTKRLLERLIIHCMKGIKITKFKSSVATNQVLLLKISGFSEVLSIPILLMGYLQNPGLVWMWMDSESCMWIQGHARTSPSSVRCQLHVFLPSKSESCEHFSYSTFFRESLLLRHTCYFSVREEAVAGYYFLLVMETRLASSVRRKCISQLVFIYVFSTVKPPALGTDASRH